MAWEVEWWVNKLSCNLLCVYINEEFCCCCLMLALLHIFDCLANFNDNRPQIPIFKYNWHRYIIIWCDNCDLFLMSNQIKSTMWNQCMCISFVLFRAHSLLPLFSRSYYFSRICRSFVLYHSLCLLFLFLFSSSTFRWPIQLDTDLHILYHFGYSDFTFREMHSNNHTHTHKHTNTYIFAECYVLFCSTHGKHTSFIQIETVPLIRRLLNGFSLTCFSCW